MSWLIERTCPPWLGCESDRDLPPAAALSHTAPAGTTARARWRRRPGGRRRGGWPASGSGRRTRPRSGGTYTRRRPRRCGRRWLCEEVREGCAHGRPAGGLGAAPRGVGWCGDASWVGTKREAQNISLPKILSPPHEDSSAPHGGGWREVREGCAPGRSGGELRCGST